MIPAPPILDYVAATTDPKQIAAYRWFRRICIVDILWFLIVIVTVIFQTSFPWEWREPWFKLVNIVGSIALVAPTLLIAMIYSERYSPPASFTLYLLAMLLVLSILVVPAFMTF